MSMTTRVSPSSPTSTVTFTWSPSCPAEEKGWQEGGKRQKKKGFKHASLGPCSPTSGPRSESRVRMHLLKTRGFGGAVRLEGVAPRQCARSEQSFLEPLLLRPSAASGSILRSKPRFYDSNIQGTPTSTPRSPNSPGRSRSVWSIWSSFHTPPSRWLFAAPEGHFLALLPSFLPWKAGAANSIGIGLYPTGGKVSLPLVFQAVLQKNHTLVGTSLAR